MEYTSMKLLLALILYLVCSGEGIDQDMCQMDSSGAPYSLIVTEVEVSGKKIDATEEVPEQFKGSHHEDFFKTGYRVDARIKYIITSEEKPVIRLYTSSYGEFSDFELSSDSVDSEVGDNVLMSEITAHYDVIPATSLSLIVQSPDQRYTYTTEFSVEDYADTTKTLQYPSVVFTCYPQETVLVKEKTAFNLLWSFMIRPMEGETKEDLDKVIINVVQSHSMGTEQTGGASIQIGNMDEMGILKSNLNVDDPHVIGHLKGEKKDLGDAYLINIKLEFEADVVTKEEIQGNFAISMFFRIMDLVTKVIVETPEYESLPDAEKTCVKSPADTTIQIEEDESDLSLPKVSCRVIGCRIDNVDLYLDGELLETNYESTLSDGALRDKPSMWKQISWMMTDPAQDMDGSVECRATDELGSKYSESIQLSTSFASSAKSTWNLAPYNYCHVLFNTLLLSIIIIFI